MVFILTHGEKNNIVMAKDVGYDLYEFIERFIPNKVQVLAAKPKLFFVQACRGNKLDAGQLIVPSRMKRAGLDQVDSITEAEPYIHPSFADLLIAFSSHYGEFCYHLRKSFKKIFTYIFQDITLLEMKLVHGLFKIYVMYLSTSRNQLILMKF